PTTSRSARSRAPTTSAAPRRAPAPATRDRRASPSRHAQAAPGRQRPRLIPLGALAGQDRDVRRARPNQDRSPVRALRDRARRPTGSPGARSYGNSSGDGAPAPDCRPISGRSPPPVAYHRQAMPLLADLAATLDDASKEAAPLQPEVAQPEVAEPELGNP